MPSRLRAAGSRFTHRVERKPDNERMPREGNFVERRRGLGWIPRQHRNGSMESIVRRPKDSWP
jgi:hypothetical protein